jgi:hypothetical protein
LNRTVLGVISYCYVNAFRVSFSSVGRQPKSDLGRSVVEVSRSRTITHTSLSNVLKE